MDSPLDKPDVSDLVSKAQAGDTDAITALYDLYAPGIYRFAVTIVKNPDIAEDISSETFLRAWAHLTTYKGGNFKAFLYTIARNYAFDVLRKEQRTIALTEAHDHLLAYNDVLRLAVSAEESRAVLTALALLPENQQEVLTLRFLEGLSVAETAKVLGKTSVSVRVMQYRALQQLQKIMS